MPYIDGLPAASAVNATDLIVVDQGFTGVPGSSTTRQATVTQFATWISMSAYMPFTGGTFTGPVALGVNLLSGSNVGFTGGTADGIVIGGTTPAAGHFTTLSATSTVSGAGFTAWAASPPAIGGTAPAAGAFTTLSSSGIFTPNSVSGIVGTTTNDNAQAGSVGEYISSTVAAGSAVALTTTVTANITSISLTAGDWDVSGNVITNPAGSTVTVSVASAIGTTSATLPLKPAGGGFAASYPSSVAGAFISDCLGPVRISVASTTTVYLMVNASFNTSTLGGYGFIGARRVR